MSPSQRFTNTIQTIEQLQSLYREPVELVEKKVCTTIDQLTNAYIQASPFAVLSTANRAGECTVSPRGGERGFAKVLDKNHLLIPDVVGNNLIMSLQNIVENPHVALLFIRPGERETLRIDGQAWLTQDPTLLDHVTDEDNKAPKLAIAIEVTQLFTHCSKSFEKAGLWDVNTWPNPDGPDIGEVYMAHLATNGLTL